MTTVDLAWCSFAIRLSFTPTKMLCCARKLERYGRNPSRCSRSYCDTPSRRPPAFLLHRTAGAAAAARRETGGLIRRETDGHRICLARAWLAPAPCRESRTDLCCKHHAANKRSSVLRTHHSLGIDTNLTLPNSVLRCDLRPYARRTAPSSHSSYSNSERRPLCGYHATPSITSDALSPAASTAPLRAARAPVVQDGAGRRCGVR